jgi:hypothetical protein
VNEDYQTHPCHTQHLLLFLFSRYGWRQHGGLARTELARRQPANAELGLKPSSKMRIHVSSSKYAHIPPTTLATAARRLLSAVWKGGSVHWSTAAHAPRALRNVNACSRCGGALRTCRGSTAKAAQCSAIQNDVMQGVGSKVCMAGCKSHCWGAYDVWVSPPTLP